MDGYKKGNLGHQSTTSAASYQLSAPDHYSHTMICFWGFLMLAVATSSVDSQCVGNVTKQNTEFKDALNKQFSEIAKTKFPSVINLDILGPLLSGVNNLFKAITGLELYNATVPSTEIQNKTNGLEIKAVIILYGRCQEISTFPIRVIINVPVYLVNKDGCLQWILINDALKFALFIDNLLLKLNLGLLTAMETALTNSLTGPVENMVTQALIEINQTLKKVNDLFFLGDKVCSHKVTGLTVQGMSAIVQIASTIGNKLYFWKNFENTNMTRNQSAMWNVDYNVFTAMIGATLSKFNTQMNIPNQQLANVSWAAQFTNGSLQLSNASVTKTNVSGSGIGLNVAISYSLSNGLMNVSSGRVTVILTCQPKYDNGFLAFSISDLSINDVSIGVLWINTMGSICTCGGGGTMQNWLMDYLNLKAAFLLNQLNILLGIWQWHLPPFLGDLGKYGECKLKTDYFYCVSY